MKILIKQIDTYNHAENFDYMWVTVSVEEETESTPHTKGEINVPIKKQDLTLSNLEDLVVEKVKHFLSPHK